MTELPDQGMTNSWPVGLTSKYVGESGSPDRIPICHHLDRVGSLPAAFPEGIDPERVPVHVAHCHGRYGRWAQQRGLGHATSKKVLFDTRWRVRPSWNQWLTVYAFSPGTVGRSRKDKLEESEARIAAYQQVIGPGHPRART